MKKKLTLSIIIVNWNVCDLLRECLNSLFKNTRMHQDDFEVFVVDNNSDDGSVDMVRRQFPAVHAVANKENVGFGKANNQVLDKCRGEFILLLNPDTLIPDRAVDRLVSHIRAIPDAAATGCRLLNPDNTLQRWTGGAFPTIWNIARHYLFLDKLLPGRLLPPPLYLGHDASRDLDVDWVSGACMLLRRECLGPAIFNEAFFMYGEDMELCWRLRKDGWRVIYTPVASIIHIQGASMKKQEGDILMSSLKGLRSFFAMTRGTSLVRVSDLLTVTGFFLRFAIYKTMSLFPSGKHLGEKAESSLKYMHIITRIMKSDRTIH